MSFWLTHFPIRDLRVTTLMLRPTTLCPSMISSSMLRPFFNYEPSNGILTIQQRFNYENLRGEGIDIKFSYVAS